MCAEAAQRIFVGKDRYSGRSTLREATDGQDMCADLQVEDRPAGLHDGVLQLVARVGSALLL